MEEKTCGIPGCLHARCMDIRAKERAKAQQDADHKKAVEDVTAALRQLLSVPPQLLYEASTKLGSDLIIEAIQVELSPVFTSQEAHEKKIDRTKYRASMCVMMSRALIQSGRARLTTDDELAMISYMNLLGSR